MAQGGAWIKFYPDDWNNDVSLRACSLSTQAVFIRLFAVLIRGQEYGVLMPSGDRAEVARVARVVGVTTKRLNQSLSELTENGVLKVDKQGRLYSKRMVNDQHKRDIGHEHGIKGGNPKLKQGYPTPLTPTLNLEAEAEIEEEAEDARAREATTTDEFPQLPDPVKESLRQWGTGASNFIWQKTQAAVLTGTPVEWIVYALDEATRYNKRNWAYVEKILANCADNGGPRTRAESEADRADRERQERWARIDEEKSRREKEEASRVVDPAAQARAEQARHIGKRRRNGEISQEECDRLIAQLDAVAT